MPPVGFEPTISAGERLQTHSLDRAATGTGYWISLVLLNPEIIKEGKISPLSGVYYRYHHVYLFTAWSKLLLEKLTGSAASQEIPRIFGTPRFITVLTSARHLSLS